MIRRDHTEFLRLYVFQNNNTAADITEQPRDDRDVPRNNCKCKINIVWANCVRPYRCKTDIAVQLSERRPL